MSLADLSVKGLYRQLLRQSAVYTSGTLLQQATSFLLLPLYLHLLTPADFGITALAGVTTTILVAILSLGSHGAITRFYWSWKAENAADAAVGTVWMTVIVFAASVTIVLARWGAPLFDWLLSSVPYDPFIRVVLLTAFFGTLNQAPLALLRAREEAGVFVRWSYVTAASALLLSVYFVAVRRQGALGVLHANLGSTALSSAIAIYLMVRRVSFTPRLGRLREALAFSLPLVPGAVLESVTLGLDRLILDKFVPLSQIGLYSIATRIADLGVRTIMVTSFKTAWFPFAIRLNTERPDGRDRTARLGMYVVGAGCWCAVATVLFSGVVFAALGRPEYLVVVPLVAVLAFGNLAQVVDLLAWVGLMMGKRTGAISFTTGVQALVAVCAYLLLIPPFGITGAAFASAISMAAMVTMKIRIAERAYPIPYEWGRIAGLAVGAAAAMVAGLATDALWGVASWQAVIVKTTWLAFFTLWLKKVALRGLGFRAQLSSVLREGKSVVPQDKAWVPAAAEPTGNPDQVSADR
ncbi:MAG TPA: oligosaccharide flippase family protein [Gemmatimonadaceae bacterium]|nr:oligosaccharide flippase family protein [Gemmatimonadaceae bacterium]